jgi:16S rRNA (adenine1518-N6/adenine1519-N6)-dimethyltransferase
VRLTPRAPNELPEHNRELFLKLIRRGFGQRRKQLAKLLKEEGCDWPVAAEQVGVRLTARAEELSLEQWIALTNFIQSIDPAAKGTDPNELFAVVDEKDQVTGAATRSEVHGNNLLHRAVHIFIFNSGGEVLLQKRSRWKDRHPDLWDSSAAGHVGAGEEYDATAARELEEELGIRASLIRVAKLEAAPNTGHEFIWLYRGEHNGPFSLAPAEIAGVQFFPAAAITDWIERRPGDFAPGFVACWRASLAREAAPQRSHQV